MGGRGGSGARGGRYDTQSRSLSWVGGLRSGNEPGMTVAQEYRQKEILGNYPASDWARARQAGFSSPRAYQASITAHIAGHGIINPGQWSSSGGRGTLDEGYHRYAAMRQLGMTSMPVRRTD
jgi:hypothetical protein